MTTNPSGGRAPGALSPDDWTRLEAMVDALLDTPVGRRSALLDQLSGSDPVRRAELERLVAECERPHALLDQPAAERFAALVDGDATHASAVLAGRYQITRELGRGGMATVYLARDLRHSRDVAVKVLRSDLAAALGGGRFLREVEIAAGLRHPNIVPVYDSGEGDGILYYVMPYEAGHSLRARLERDGRLPLDDTLLIVRDVCDALAHAHRHGIVHRDIKPDNVLLAGRHALVTDFGVAKAIAAASGVVPGSEREAATVTTAGVSLGTPAYMAPEQIVADPRIDHRADIYAMGVLAYELLAGRPPFQGDEPQSVLAAHLTETPQPVTVHRPEVPSALAELVMRCLEKKPKDRWQSADDLLAHLERLVGPVAVADLSAPVASRAVADQPDRRPIATRVGRRRLAVIAGAAVAVAAVAVLAVERIRARGDRAPPLDPGKIVVVPFRVLGVDSSLRYLGEGVVDLLAAKLTGEGGPLAVDARTSISAWKQVSKGSEPTADHARRVARMVGAAEALSGSVVSLPGDRLTITANVISASGGVLRPALTLSGPVDSFPSMLEAIATRMVARQAGVSEQTLSAITSESVPALRAYLWGRDEYRRGHDREAIEHFDRAIDLDSTFALAALDLVVAVGQPLGVYSCAATAECRISYFVLGFLNPGPDSYHQRVERAVEVAWQHREKLGPRDRPLLEALRGEHYPEPATARAMLAGLQRAATLAPDRVETHYLLGNLLLYQGPALEVVDSRGRAAASFRRAVDLDSAYTAPIAGLVEVAAFDHDTAALRRWRSLYLSRDSFGATADYVRWRVAMALGDSASLALIRARFDALDVSTLQRIIHASLTSGIDLTDAARASSIVVDRASDVDQRRIALFSAYLLAMNRGRPREATGLLERHSKIKDDPIASLTWATMAGLFWDGDTAAAYAAVRARTARITRDTSTGVLDSVRARGVWAHIAQQGLWDVMHGDTARAAAAVRWLRRHGRPLNADLVDVLLAAQTGRPDADALRSRIDSVMVEGCCTKTIVHWANLVVARAYETAGRDTDALRAVRRGVWRFPPQLLSTFLREEGRLAAKQGDRAEAIRAYRHYLVLRSDPEAELRPEVDRVRAELARLEQGR